MPADPSFSSAYTVIVNTSDGYSDCWRPFFVLFNRYWRDCPARVLLNTELTDFDAHNPAVEATRVQQASPRRLTWGECALRCLDRVRTPLVLYLQEDYFLDAPVNTARLDALAGRMLDDPRIGQVGLTRFGAHGPFTPADDPRLWLVDARSRYRTSLQAAFWRTDVFRSYVRPEENGWMFEIYGTRRSWRRRERFLTVNRDLERTDRVFPYEFTGIVKGQWHPAMPDLFAREGIEMDFARRGFFVPLPRALEKLRTARKLLERPGQFARGMLGAVTDAFMLGAFALGVLVMVWRMALRDMYYAGFTLFFLVYTIFAMLGYRFYPVLSMLLNAYFGQELWYTYFWFVAASFAAMYLAFRLLHPVLIGRACYRVAYHYHEDRIWVGLAAPALLVLWMAATLPGIYPRISYGGLTPIPSAAYNFAFHNLPELILVLLAFALWHAQTPLQRGVSWALVASLVGLLLVTALKASFRNDLLALGLGLLWLAVAPLFLDVQWRPRIRWNRATVTRAAVIAVSLGIGYLALEAIKRGRRDAPLDLPTNGVALLNDYYAPAHILFASIAFHYVKPLLVLKSNLANAVLLGGRLNIPYLQTDIGNMLLPGSSSRSQGFAYFIFSEGYMAAGRWGVLYNGIVPVVCLALGRRLGRTVDVRYNALIGAMAATVFPTVARSGNHLTLRIYIVILIPYLLFYRFLTGATLHRVRLAAVAEEGAA